tara:strand:- start:8216 stop:8800 length:585 start_codon:yes stop_codon:yes gene_type:complete
MGETKQLVVGILYKILNGGAGAEGANGIVGLCIEKPTSGSIEYRGALFDHAIGYIQCRDTKDVWGLCEGYELEEVYATPRKIATASKFSVDFDEGQIHMQASIDKMSKDITEQKEYHLVKALYAKGINMDLSKEIQKRFSKLRREIIGGHSETYYYDDGSDDGLRIITFVEEMDLPQITNDPTAFSVRYNIKFY